MKLAETRARKLLSAGRFAQTLGISKSHLYGIEKGRWLPSLDLVRRMCEVLEVAEPMEIDEFRAAIEKSVRGKELARVS
jgi:DNA-binding XRE family transcriptional regulator